MKPLLTRFALIGFVGLFAVSFLAATTSTALAASGVWTLSGNLVQDRENQTANLLGNGKVLVAGGDTVDWWSTSTAESELYNPATGTWSTTGSMNQDRTEHVSALLPNGYVLVAGGLTENISTSTLASAELYNPATGTWSFTGSLNMARSDFTATLLPNGLVLVAGGYGSAGSNPLTSAELYNPATGTWSLTGSLHEGRAHHTATLLSNGTVLVTGGASVNSFGQADALASAEVYNPATGTWSVTGSLHTARQQHTATLLSNGKVLVAGGYDTNTQSLASAELYNPSTGAWSLTGNLSSSRAAHTATLLQNGQVLVAGGFYSSFSSAELYNPSTGTWSTTGSMLNGRANFTATLLSNGQVLVAAGLYGNGTSERYTP